MATQDERPSGPLERPDLGRRRSRRRLIPALLTLAALAATPGGAQPSDPPPGTHGMLVLGTEGKIYLLHLAMRSNPAHKFQLVLEAELEGGEIADRTFVGEGGDLAALTASEIYFRDRNHPDNPVTVYTLFPSEPFVLTEIPRGERSSFRANVVRGHFERDSKPPTLLEDAVVAVRRVLFFQDFRELDPGALHPLAEGKLEMLLFGGRGDYFLSHRITLHSGEGNPGDNAFHQVFPVLPASAERLRFDSLRQAVPLTVEGAEATPQGRLPAAGGRFPAQLEGLIEGVPTPLTFDIEVGPEHYLEVLF